MESSTKQRILDSAVSLFNQQGIANVRLMQISDETGISVGNLAYHYKNKEAIVEAVYGQLFEEFADVLTVYMNDASLLDFDNQITAYYEFFRRNRFYLSNLFEIEKNYPAIHSKWQRNISKMIIQLRKRLDFLVDASIIHNEEEEGDFDYLAQAIWTTMVFWIPQQVMRSKSLRNDLYRRAVWSLLVPFFTKKGKEEYNHLIRPLIYQV